MPVRARVVDRDRGYRALLRSARSSSGSLEVGVFLGPRSSPYPRGQTVADVAALHEAGTRRMPRRPFLSRWWDTVGQRRVRVAVRDALAVSLVRNQREPFRLLTAVGRQAVRDVRAGFAKLRPLAPSTVRRKRSRRVLYETGRLWRAVSFRVNRQAGRRS